VQYYFQVRIEGSIKSLALISRYSAPNKHLLQTSHGTLSSSYYLGNDELQVIDIKDIRSVVAMIPHTRQQEYCEAGMEQKPTMFLIEKVGLGYTQNEDIEEE
jgi:hypothetical protein